MKKTDLAYLAGILDGEGSIQIRKRKDKGMRLGFCYQLVVNIANTNEWLVRWIHLNFGGLLYKNRIPAAHYKQVYQWSVSSNKAKFVLESLLPYLKIKKPQAEIALQFQSQKIVNSGGKIKPTEAIALEDAQRILIQSYNDNRRKNITAARKEE